MTSDYRVKRLCRSPTRDVAFDEADVRLVRVLTPLPRHREGIAGTIQSHDGSLRTDEFAQHPRHMAKARPEVEHSHASCNARSLQQQPRRARDRGRLPIQTGEFIRIVTEHVAATLGRFRHHADA